MIMKLTCPENRYGVRLTAHAGWQPAFRQLAPADRHVFSVAVTVPQGSPAPGDPGYSGVLFARFAEGAPNETPGAIVTIVSSLRHSRDTCLYG